MQFHKKIIEGVYVIEPERIEDHRGMFARVYCSNEIKKIDHVKPIVNINHSATSKKGTIRGMHFQVHPKAEIKIVKCIKGSIFDVIIDLRKGSSTFLQWYGVILSAENMKMLYVPERFAHGFQSLKDNIEMIYCTTEFFSLENERGIRFDDPKIKIDWPLKITDISQKDKNLVLLSNDFEGLEV